ncbi:MAG: restriction endonuclease [Cyanobacteria bacterium SIG28]|nr:restriction endonuclease [Cyanobacteria bacterium SIG28]
MTEILSSNKIPRIYAYTEPQFKETPWQGKNRNGKGLIKIGFTTKSAQERIAEQFGTNKPIDNPYEILLDEIAIRFDGTYFTDHDVHRVLEKAGYYRFSGSEWFECTLEEVKQALFAVKNHKFDMSKRIANFKMRPEQAKAVKLTSEYFRKYPYEKEGKTPHFLWNAKMRFGKTFTSYQLAKEMNWSKVLVLTFKPAVQNSWEEDLKSHVDFQDWQFVSRTGLQYNEIDHSKPFVWFASFQDVLQKTEAGGIKPRNEEIHLINWDCIILDEYHFGAWRDSAKDLYDAEDKKEQAKQNGEGIDYYDEEQMPLTTKSYLYLSGTPFRALNNGEFLEDQIFNWTYTDEQREKNSWDETKGANPYSDLPKMVLMTYKMPDEIKQIALGGEFNEFSLNEFFSAGVNEGVNKGVNEGDKNELPKFKYEQEVVNWLNLIRGQYKASTIDELKIGKKPPMPYSDYRLLGALNHTFWFLPSVASCKAMGELLKKHPFYNEYQVIICAGNDAGMGVEALKPVREAIKNGFATKTITLSCGKLTTGVTVSEWGGIFMLRDTASPETYFQSAFRVQSPWTVKNPDGLNPNEKSIIKDTCYVFDFAPDRALRQIAEYSARLNVDSKESPEEKVSEFISFLPVLCYDGSHMDIIDANELLDLVISGTASSMLARRWESALLVNVDNETLSKLLDSEKAMEALSKIEGFRNLNKELTTLVNKSEALKKAKQEKKEELTKEEKKELTEQEKEIKSKRKEIQEKLLKFATRIPVFMYLTDNREQTLKDVITQLEPELFQKVTGLTMPDFELLVSIGIFNEQIMNSAVFAFKRYEDASLSYTGISKHEELLIGGWDTRITKEEFVNID